MKFSQLNNNNSILDKFSIDIQKSKQGEGSRGGKVIGHTRSGKPIYDRFDHEAHSDFTKEDRQDVIRHFGKKHHQEALDEKIEAHIKRGFNKDAGDEDITGQSGKAVYKLHDVKPPKMFGVKRAVYKSKDKTITVTHSKYSASMNRGSATNGYSVVYEGDDIEGKEFKGDNHAEKATKYLKNTYGIEHSHSSLKELQKSDDNDLMKADSKKKDKEQSYKYNPGSIQHSIQTVISKLLPAKDKGFKLPVGKWNKEGEKIDYMAQVSFDAAQPRPPFHKMKQMIADELGIEGSKVIVQSLGKEELEPDKKLKEGEKPEQQWRAHIIITVPREQMEQLSLRDHFDDNEEQEMKARQKEKENNKMKKSEGSRGGVVLGHTPNGKPIYKNSKDSHEGFNKWDHYHAAQKHKSYVKQHSRDKNNKEQVEHHEKMAKYHEKLYNKLEKSDEELTLDIDLDAIEQELDKHQRMASKKTRSIKNYKASIADIEKEIEEKSRRYQITHNDFILQDINDLKFDLGNYERVLKELEKSEGSRGGHVIGHTKSGKPIYSSASHPDHDNFTSEEHREAAAHHRKKAGDVNDDLYNTVDKNDYVTRSKLREKRAHHKKQAELHESSAEMREKEKKDHVEKSDTEELTLDIDLDTIEQELDKTSAGDVARQKNMPELGKIFDSALNDIKKVLNK